MFQTRGLEIVVIAIIVFVLFGAKRLPDSARALGRSLRIFRAETQAMRDENPASLRPENRRRDEHASRTPREVPSARPEPAVFEGRVVQDEPRSSH